MDTIRQGIDNIVNNYLEIHGEDIRRKQRENPGEETCIWYWLDVVHDTISIQPYNHLTKELLEEIFHLKV